MAKRAKKSLPPAKPEPAWAQTFMDSIRAETEAESGLAMQWEQKRTPDGRPWWALKIVNPSKVRSWPTPTASMIQNRSGRYMGGNPTLEGLARSLDSMADVGNVARQSPDK